MALKLICTRAARPLPAQFARTAGIKREPTLDPTKRYELFRDYLKHEDGLINNRLVWSLTIQSFAFAAFALVSTKGNPSLGAGDVLQALATWGIPLFGILIGLAAASGIYAAHRAIQHLLVAYHRAGTHPPSLPMLTDGGSDPAVPLGTLASLCPPLVVCAAWSLIFASSQWHLGSPVLGVIGAVWFGIGVYLVHCLRRIMTAASSDTGEASNALE
ncbi:MAG TPA: hypothetical protein VI197_12280 [Polyangiaceae bacterium]